MNDVTHKTILIAAFTLFFGGCASQPDLICDGRVKLDSVHFGFTSNEMPLICGDSEVVGWKNVPLSQTEFNLKNFFKARGYYDVSFKLDPTNADRLIVNPGTEYHLKNVVFENAPSDFLTIGYIGWKGRPIIKDTLDEIEGWTIRRLKNLGYACVVVKLEAVLETHVLHVKITSGPKYLFPPVTDEPGKSLPREVMRRNFAFNEGDTFDQSLLDLTTSRMENSGVVAKSSFVTTCAKDLTLDPAKATDSKTGISIEHSVFLGPPRLFQIGAGISTEEFPIARISFKNTRLGDNASQFSTQLYASQLKQNAQIGFDIYPFEHAGRWFYEPTLQLQRVNEEYQKFISYTVYNYFGTTLDVGRVRLASKMGPAVAYQNTILGPTIEANEFLTWETSTQLNSHLYEVNASSPIEGFQLGLDTSSLILANEGKSNAHLISLTGSQLFNLGNYDPAQLILGVRGGLRTVLLGQPQYSAHLPAQYFSWLGGDTDVRGFGRKEIPNTQIGALSSAFFGTELRAPALLPKNFDPFVFVDLGWIGLDNLHFLSALYWSPGTGLRWQSPIGAIRLTVAHGYVTEKEMAREHFQFFISLGREF